MIARITAALLVFAAAVSACASVFFSYYTLRLTYLAATGLIDAAHRTAGLHIGAAVFPVASFCFGCVSLSSARLARRRLTDRP